MQTVEAILEAIQKLARDTTRSGNEIEHDLTRIYQEADFQLAELEGNKDD